MKTSPRIVIVLAVALGMSALALHVGRSVEASKSRGPEKSISGTSTLRPSDAPALRPSNLRLCQALGPAAPHPIWGVDSLVTCGRGEPGWDARGPIPWQAYAQGEYVGHARLQHVPEYRLRVDDALQLIYRLTREESRGPYELEVGDQIHIEAADEPEIDRDLIVQPDGTIMLPLIGPVRAKRRTLVSVQNDLEQRYRRYLKEPRITVTPLKVNTRLEDLRDAVDARQGQGGQQLLLTVTPAGTISVPAIGTVTVQGMTLEELKREVDARYAATIPGIEVTVVLAERAPRFVYVLGEVATPGRFELVGPTSLMQALALAGSWNVGANLRQVVVIRRADDWRMMATMVDIRGALYARRPCPADDIWLNDSDVVVVPKTPIQIFDEFIGQWLTQGLYSAVPAEVIWDLSSISTL
jgi:polysaccharide export outer membrane protein